MIRKNRKKLEMQGNGIRKSDLMMVGYLLLFLGMMGRGILETRVLGVNTGSGEDLLKVLEMSGGMTAASTALFLEAMEMCAIPIFAVLTLDGFERTLNIKKYILRVLAVALVSEIFYNFTFSGSFYDPTSKNPAFGTALCLIMLWIYSQYEGEGFTARLIRLVVGVASLLWAAIFRINFGVIFLLVVNVLWLFRKRPAMKEFMAAVTALCCCVANPLAMFSPFGFLVTHWYRGEKGFYLRKIQYAMYPLLLLLTGMIGILLF